MARRRIAKPACAMEQSEAMSLRQLRWSRGLRLELCADAIGVSIREFLAKERGRSSFTAQQVEQLASLLDVDGEAMRRVMSSDAIGATHASAQPTSNDAQLSTG